MKIAPGQREAHDLCLAAAGRHLYHRKSPEFFIGVVFQHWNDLIF
jgi:hypothetical protein